MQNSQERGARGGESYTYGATSKMASCLHPWENITVNSLHRLLKGLFMIHIACKLNVGV